MTTTYTNFFLFKEQFLLNNKKLVLIGLSDISSYVIISKSLFSGQEVQLLGETLSKAVFQEEVENYNFFYSHKDIVLYKAEDFKQGEALLTSYFHKPNHHNRLIVIVSTKALFDLLVKAGDKKFLLALSLFDEKSYEKTKRLYVYLQSFLNKEKVRCSSSVLQEFLSFCSHCSHKQILEHIHKVICFVGDKKAITSKDIALVLGEQTKSNFWEIRDLILKRQRKALLELFKRNERKYKEEALSLIAFLRTQMLFGLSLINQKGASEKKALMFTNYGVENLKKSIVILFEIEQNLKASKLSPSINLEILFINLTQTV